MIIAITEPPSLEQAKSYIYALDFTNLINKLINHQGWKKNSALEVSSLYKNFLYINKKYNQTYGVLPPSEEIDQFWHSHILDTKIYHADCIAIFGYYFHHYPYFGIDGKSNLTHLNAAFENLQKLHLQEFGTYIEKIRTHRLKSFLMKATI